MKKGFTLVELLAVIAILAILVIIAIPNVLKLFNEAKKNTFVTEAKSVYKEAQREIITRSMNGTLTDEISSEDDTKLSLTGNELKYLIKLDGKKIISITVSNDDYTVSGGTNFLTEDLVVNEISLKNKTSDNDYFVSFYDDSGNLIERVAVDSGSVNVTTNFLEAHYKDNYIYIFDNWYTSLNGNEVASLSNIYSNLNVYAKYSKIEAMSFNINGTQYHFFKTLPIGDMTWGIYLDYCTQYRNNFCPQNLTMNNTLMYIDGQNLLDEGFSNITATKVITEGARYGDENYLLSSCFVPGTKIYTENGYKNIENVNIGDKVWTIDENTFNKSLGTVTNLIKAFTKDLYEIYVGDEVIKVSPSHPFYVKNKGWVTVDKLNNNDLLYFEKTNEFVSISKIIYIKDANVDVYNLTVNNNHNYFVTYSNILVHNKPS